MLCSLMKSDCKSIYSKTLSKNKFFFLYRMSTVIITEKKDQHSGKNATKNLKFQNESTRDSKITNSINNVLCYTKQPYRKKPQRNNLFKK